MSLSSAPDLSTYEGRREAWVLEMLDDKYVPYRGGGLEARHSVLSKRECCCLGVACRLITECTGGVLMVTSSTMGHSLEFGSIFDHADRSQGFLPLAAALWLGIDSRPNARVDQQFLDEFTAENARRKEAGEDTIIVHPIGDTPRLPSSPLNVGDLIGLHTLNDNDCPWTFIAGLISRGCIHGAKTGPVAA